MLKLFHWHKWKYVKVPIAEDFLGEKIVSDYDMFRVCEKCGEVQELKVDSGGSYWVKLNEIKSDILKNKIQDKGSYYKLLTFIWGKD